eukprot:COSAG04_NODE_3424_length_2823_cov_1.744860_3_plen_223_part_00
MCRARPPSDVAVRSNGRVAATVTAQANRCFTHIVPLCADRPVRHPSHPLWPLIAIFRHGVQIVDQGPARVVGDLIEQHRPALEWRPRGSTSLTFVAPCVFERRHAGGMVAECDRASERKWVRRRGLHVRVHDALLQAVGRGRAWEPTQLDKPVAGVSVARFVHLSRATLADVGRCPVSSEIALVHRTSDTRAGCGPARASKAAQNFAEAHLDRGARWTVLDH